MRPPSTGSRVRFSSLRRIARTFTRSAAVGLVATAVDLGVLALIVGALHRSPTLANVPGLLAGAAVQFWGNKYFAFEDRSPVVLAQATGFGAVTALTFLLNALGYELVVNTFAVHYLLARPLSEVLVYVGFTFPLWHRVFGAGRRRAATTAASAAGDSDTNGWDEVPALQGARAVTACSRDRSRTGS